MIYFSDKNEQMKMIISKLCFFVGLKPIFSFSLLTPHLKKCGYSSNFNLLFSNKLTPPFRVGDSRYQTVKGFNPKTDPKELDNSVILHVNFNK